MILQYVYRPVLNFIYEKITYRISEKYRNMLIFLCFLSVFSVQFLSQYILGYDVISRGTRDYLICLFLGVAIVMSVKDYLKILKWRKSIYIPYLIVGLLIFFASIDHYLGVGYRAFPFEMLVAFMSLYYVWGNRKDYNVLFELIAKSYLVFSFILFIGCLIKYPYYDHGLSSYITDYSPYYINPNGVSKLFLPGLASAVFLLTKNQAYIRLIYAGIAGGISTIIYLANSRTGILCCTLIIIIYIAYKIFLAYKDGKINVGIKGIVVDLLIMACIGLISVSILIMTSVRSLDDVEAARKAVESMTEEQRIEQMSDEELHKYNLKMQGAENISDSKLLSALNKFTASRVAIWNIYFNNMTWSGEDELLFGNTEYAHNQYIELSYKAGIPTGIIYLLLIIAIGIKLIFDLFKNANCKKYIVFQLFVFIIYFVTTMLDTGILPFERGYIFVFYVIIAPMFILDR